MINKQSLWFLTLFSLILVLSVYYITMPNDLLLTNSDRDEFKKAKGQLDGMVLQLNKELNSGKNDGNSGKNKIKAQIEDCK